MARKFIFFVGGHNFIYLHMLFYELLKGHILLC